MGTLRRFPASVLQIALALFLLASGARGLVHVDAGVFNAAVYFLGGLFRGHVAIGVLTLAVSLCCLTAGFFLLVDFLRPELSCVSAVLALFVVLWALNMVLVDVVGAFGRGKVLQNVSSALEHLHHTAVDLLVLGALIFVRQHTR
ncbi:hypothetical protein [Treponema pallidum]|uniref:DUF4383 domain-containing protein n=2 Tax=Treponema pallidum TaxID=160 RepID=A0AAU8S1H9_TREPL|nr:hypothetical protein [Treponema pallidum]AEZ57762.1 putative membrane protein [Treponema pallidum subsp. pertenue str. SamoaD]AEZ58831.1 putative membrane protein [Treponema pallidum subsp. pertenue str. CDC2]AEZ59899.1 putative membrane protein [Treponema pallidum subsp. pertenue str. Gauthier]AGK84283.1 putative membrane protein [Treponema pallidum str. Fribourg-Blanc]AJB40659.1 hypothetical protein TENDBA_0638 [Treponema pallidum subsp. endemicum str. Bosnia A]